MDEEKKPKETPFDAEWEMQKMGGRFSDILNMIEELRQKDRSLSARISRLKLAFTEGQPYTEEPEPEDEMLSKIENMPLDERAVYLSDLIDRFTPPPP